MTWANQIRILRQQLEALAAVIGGTLINALKPLVKALNTAMGHIISFAKTISNALGKIFGWTYEEGGGGVAQDFESAAGYSDDLEKSTGKTADNVKKIQKGIRAFDELKLITLPENTGAEGGGGGGTGIGGMGAAGAAGGEWKKTESEIKKYESVIDNLYDLGKHIGDTLTKVLEGINWKSVYEKAGNFGKGLAQFLNGLISPELFYQLGRTIAGSLNAALHFLNEFGKEFDWSDFGLSIAAGVNKFLKTFDFNLLANTLNTWANGILDTIITFLSKTDWSLIGTKIGNFLARLDYMGVGKKIAQAIWEAISSAFKVFASSFKVAPLETLITSLIVVPKLIKAIGNSRLVKGIAKIASNFLIFSKNASLAVAALSGNKTALSRLSASFPKLGKSIDVTRKAFANFRFGIENGNFATGLNEGIKTIRSNLSGLQKGAITAVAGFAEFEIVSSTFKGLTDGSENLVAGIAKIGGTVAVAATAMYTALGPAGIAISAVTGLVAAVKGINDAIEEIQLESMFETIKTVGVTSLSSLGEVANTAFSNITNGVESTVEKLNSIANVKENIGKTVENIEKIKTAIDNGAYAANEKVPEIIGQFQNLLSETESIFNQEYDVIVGNLSGAMVDVLQANGVSIPEQIAKLAELRGQGTQAISDLNKEFDKLVEQYNNGSISAEEFNNSSMPILEKLKSVGNEIDSTVTSLQNLSGALDVSDYIKDGMFQVSEFEAEISKVSDVALEGKENLETMRQEYENTVLSYKSQLEGLGLDVSGIDWKSLVGANDEVINNNIAAINSAYQDYANQVQYCLTEQLPDVVDDATSGYEDLKWWEKLFTSKEDYVRGEVEKWEENILNPALKSIGESFDGTEIWGDEAAKKLVDSFFEPIILQSSSGTDKSERLKENWKTILTDSLNGLSDAVKADEYGKDTVEGFNNGIKENVGTSITAVNEWMSEVEQTGIHDGVFNYGSPSETTWNYGKYTVDGFNLGISENTQSTLDSISAYMNAAQSKFLEFQSGFVDIGSQIMSGLMNGMSSMESSLYEKAKGIADNIASTIQTSLDIHSPSRVMFKLGDYTMQGFQLGMENMYNTIIDSAKVFGKNLQAAPAPNINEFYESYKYSYELPKTSTYETVAMNNHEKSNNSSEISALLRRQNELLEKILEKPILSNDDVFRAAKSVYKGEAKRRYGNGAKFDPVWG